MARLEFGSKEMARSPLPYCSAETFLYYRKEILGIFKIKFSEDKLIFMGGGGLTGFSLETFFASMVLTSKNPGHSKL